jgi:hypothetical protein
MNLEVGKVAQLRRAMPARNLRQKRNAAGNDVEVELVPLGDVCARTSEREELGAHSNDDVHRLEHVAVTREAAVPRVQHERRRADDVESNAGGRRPPRGVEVREKIFNDPHGCLGEPRQNRLAVDE